MTWSQLGLREIYAWFRLSVLETDVIGSTQYQKSGHSPFILMAVFIYRDSQLISLLLSLTFYLC